MRQDNTSQVHQWNLSSPQRVPRCEDCLDFSCLELIVIEVERGAVRFHCCVEFSVETHLAEDATDFGWGHTQ